MKKPSSKIKEEIARLQEQLKATETKEAERIGRVALRAGLGEMEIDDTELHAAFEDLAERFRKGAPKGWKPTPVKAGAPSGSGGEA